MQSRTRRYSLAKRILPPALRPAARGVSRRARRIYERAVAGGPWRGQLLTALLLRHYRGRFRLAWGLANHPPHFTDFRWVATEFAFGDFTSSGFNRAFFTAELLRNGDRLLDIGCGDGFADRRFYSERCSRIDALDIEPDAIAAARSHNAAPNVTYHLANAISTPFPDPPYDVIVWDGAIGHFPPDATDLMLAKIREALTPDGIFTGSESLGRSEGAADHLRFFDDLDELLAMLRGVFPHVRTREQSYLIPGGLVRREAYWRCAIVPDRLDGHWR